MLIHLCGYISTLIFLGDNFEFRMSYLSETHVHGYPQTHFGSYQTSMMEFLLRNLTVFERIGPKILLAFPKIQLRICTLITLKVHNSNLKLFSLAFYDHSVFHDADFT